MIAWQPGRIRIFNSYLRKPTALICLLCLIASILFVPLSGYAQEQQYPLLNSMLTHEEVLVSKPEGNGMSAYQPLERNEQGQYILDVYSNPQWLYQINASYQLPAGYFAQENPAVVEYALPAGLNVRGVVPDHEYVLADTTGVTMGTYRLVNDSNGTRFRITFNDDTIARNATNAVDGWLCVMISLDDDIKSNGGHITLPNGTEIVVKPTVDINIDKTVGSTTISENGTSRTMPYTLTITTDYGTPARIELNDELQSAIGIPESLTIVKKTADGIEKVQLTDADGTILTEAWNTDRTVLHGWLDALNSGESYVITYNATPTVTAGQSANVTNQATVISENDSMRTEDQAQTNTWVDNQPQHYKQAVSINSDDTVTWKVWINSNHANLNGYTWRDEVGDELDKPNNIQLCDADHHCTPITLSEEGYQFTGDDYRAYTIEYTTKTQSWQSSYRNVSRLCREDRCQDSTAEYRRAAAFGKRGELISQRSEDGKRIATIRWTVTAGGEQGFPANPSEQQWKFTDTLQQSTDGSWTQYLTKEQETALADSIRRSIADMVGDADVQSSVEFTTDSDGNVSGFIIGADRRIPEGRTATFSYETTVAFTTTYGVNIGNCVTDNIQDHACPTVWVSDYTPVEENVPDKPTAGALSVGKRDTGRYANQWLDDKSQAHSAYADTTHNYDGLRSTRTADGDIVPYLEWTVDVVPDMSQVDQPLVVTERLPQGTTLLTGTNAYVDSGQWIVDDAAGMYVDVMRWMDTNKNVFQFDDEGKASVTRVTYRDSNWSNPVTTAYATAQYDKAAHTVTVTFTPEFLQWYKAQVSTTSWQDQRISLVVRVSIDEVGSVMNGTVFTNSVEVTHGSASDTSKHSQTIHRDAREYSGKEVLNKIPQYDEQSGLIATRNAVDYQLHINPKELCLRNEGDNSGVLEPNQCPSVLNITDVMTYRHEIGYDDSEFVLDPESVHVYRDALCIESGDNGKCAAWEQDAQTITRVKYVHSDDGAQYGADVKYCRQTGSVMGSAECQSYRPADMTGWDIVPNTEQAYVVELRHGIDYTYEWSSAKPTEYIESYLHEVPPKYTYEWSNTLKFHVPNETALTIAYQYKGYGNPQAWVGASNVMHLDGRDFTPSDEQFAVNLASATAGAQIAGANITVQKIDASDGALKLADAHFSLEAYECSVADGTQQTCSWNTIRDDLVSDNNGNVLISGDDITYNRAYRLTERQAPDGYTLPSGNDAVTLFYIGKFKPNTDMLPDDKYPWQCPVDDDGTRQCGEQKVNGGTLFIQNEPHVIVLPQAGATVTHMHIIWYGMVLTVVACIGFIIALRRSNG